jgi:hypothetical protein
MELVSYCFMIFGYRTVLSPLIGDSQVKMEAVQVYYIHD